MVRKYAIAGTGVRAITYAESLLKDYAGQAELVALFDRNELRMDGFNQLLGTQIPGFTDFEKMVAETRPTHLIICTPDCLHQQHIEMGFAHGMDCITEKPLAVDAEKVSHILALEREFGRKVTVTFNYRYNPYTANIKAALMNNQFGRILSVTLEWSLDKEHGAEYFRRWHSDIGTSGGLLVHKATHHFDLVNWWLDDKPESVSAFGALNVYGKNGALRGERCSTCRHAGGECPFEMKVHNIPEDKKYFDKLYWEAEQADGYIRDRCLFDPSINIYDTMNALVKYRGGAQLSYSLNAYSPTEGFRLTMIGTEGRLEACESHSRFAIGDEKFNSYKIITNVNGDPVQTHEEVFNIDIERTPHGGGDVRLCRSLFSGDVEDPLGQMADSYDGAMSCLIGIAANESIKNQAAVRIDDLLVEPTPHPTFALTDA